MATIKDFILANTENMEQVTEIAEHGCASGVFWPLVYYTDTHAFFDTHYDEIMELVEEFNEETGTTLDDIVKDGDLKNNLARFAVEYIAQHITSEEEG